MSDPVLRLNIVMSAAILLVLALRGPVRSRAGAGAAYALWLLVPLAMVADLLPARVAHTVFQEAPRGDIIHFPGRPPSLPAAVGQAAARSDGLPLLVELWAAGFVASLGLLAWRHERFLRRMGRLLPFGADARVRQAQGKLGGPALVGVIWPRIVVPADFEGAYSPKEREVMLAHERTHLSRGDHRINAAAALVQCAFWYNPLVYAAVWSMRIDQELSCDEAVVMRHPKARRTYAEVLLKSQLADIDLPLGCYWPARTVHPLKARLAMLAEPARTVAARVIGYATVAGLMAGAGAVAWASQPPRIEASRVQLESGPHSLPARTQTVAQVTPATRSRPAERPVAEAASATLLERTLARGDCERALRLGASPEQYATCMREHPQSPTGTEAERAMAAGDCDRLLRLERVAEMVRCEQAKGRYLDVDPENPPLVSQSFSGQPPYPVRPLPPLPPSNGAETRPLQAAWAEPRRQDEFTGSAECGGTTNLAKLPSIVRCEQTHGRLLDVDPENAPYVTRIPSRSPERPNPARIYYPVRPLPPLPEGSDTFRLNAATVFEHADSPAANR